MLEIPSQRSLHCLTAVVIAAGLGITVSAGAGDAPLPPGYTTARVGNVDDFDDLAGAWTTQQQRLKERGTGGDEWETFPATLCMTEYLDGKANVDEVWFPTQGRAGLTVRTFDTDKRQWSVYWVSGATGVMSAPVVGGFSGRHGEFYGEDIDNGRPVKVRFIFEKLDRDHARWEQAFSYDNRSWETNWRVDFERAEGAEVCVLGRPKR